MGPAKTFRDLVVWGKAHELVLATYGATMVFPKHELYGLTSQLRRSVVSIPANIAEGSLEETRYYFILATDLGYVDCAALLARLKKVSHVLDAYARKICNAP